MMRYFIQDFKLEFENISLNDAETDKGQAISESFPYYIEVSVQN
jgi:hypothetical protein